MMNDKEMQDFIRAAHGLSDEALKALNAMRSFRELEAETMGEGIVPLPWARIGAALVVLQGFDAVVVENAVNILEKGQPIKTPRRKRRTKEEIAADKAAAEKRQAAIDAAPTQSLPPAAPEVPSLTQPQQPAAVETDDEKLARLTSEAAARRAAPAPEGVDPMATHPHVTPPPPPPPPATLPDGGVVATMELPDLGDDG